MDTDDTEAEPGTAVGTAVVPASERVRRCPRRPNRTYVKPIVLPTGAHQYTLTEPGYQLVETMSAEGNDLATIARALGMDRTTFQTLRERDPRAQASVEYGRALLSDELTDLLMESARSGVIAAQIFMARSRAGFVNEGGTIEGMPQPKIVNNTQVNIQLCEPMTPEQLRALIQPPPKALEHDPAD